jgi:hypothetical protein
MEPDSTQAGHADRDQRLPDPPPDEPATPVADPRPSAPILIFPRRIRDDRDDPGKVVNE